MYTVELGSLVDGMSSISKPTVMNGSESGAVNGRDTGILHVFYTNRIRVPLNSPSMTMSDKNST